MYGILLSQNAATLTTYAHVIGLPRGWTPGPTRGIVKWVEQSSGFPSGVVEFNKTMSPGSSGYQRKIPLISTS